MKKQAKKKIPKFKSEDAERQFWAKVDATDHFDFSQAKKATLPNLKPSTKSISLRLPESMLDQIKSIANERDVPYQSFIKMILAEKLKAKGS